VLSEKKVKYPRYIRLSTELREMWKQANLSTDSANHRNSIGRKLKSVTIIALLLISMSILLVKPGVTQGELATIKIDPYPVGRRLDIIDVPLRVYNANYTEGTDVYSWQVDFSYNFNILELNQTSFITWGAFMDGPRITETGRLMYNAPAGQRVVNVTDGSKYWAGYPVLVKDDLHQETNTVSSVIGNKITLTTNLLYSYTVAANAGCYPDPDTTTSVSYDKTIGSVLVGITTSGPAPGATGNGLLATLQFRVKTATTTLLNITSEYTYIQNVIGETLGDQPGEINKGNGYFVAMQAYDTKPNGLIDVYDLYTLGKNWAKCPQQHKVPTTVPSGTWTSPTNAYMTDDVRASAVDNAVQVYGGFGFTTTSWSGVSKVEIGVERRAISLGGTLDDTLRIEVSNNGGTSWSATQNNEVVNWSTDKFTWFDFTGAYAWTPAFVGNIAVRISYVRGSGVEDSMQVDWVTVRVTPTPTSASKYADVNADSIVNTPDLTQLAPQYGTNYLP
jgi:hypothetical protein